jgi:hypothetical protein
VFLLDKSLKLHLFTRGDYSVVAWADQEGDAEDLYEYVCDLATSQKQLQAFVRGAHVAMYERKYKTAGLNATQEDLDEFVYNPYERTL